jgi:hypothetical protein
MVTSSANELSSIDALLTFAGSNQIGRPSQFPVYNVAGDDDLEDLDDEDFDDDDDLDEDEIEEVDEEIEEDDDFDLEEDLSDPAFDDDDDDDDTDDDEFFEDDGF